MAARSADQIIVPGKGILSGLTVLAMKTAKMGAFVATGFLAAEVGSSALRTGVASIEAFAAKGMAQSAALRGGVGTAVTVATALVLTQGKLRDRKRIAAAAKVALFMELGVAASASREYLAMWVAKINASVATHLHPAAKAGAMSFTPSYANVRQLRGAGTLNYPGGTVARYGGMGTDPSPTRAGGDAGFAYSGQGPSFIDPTRITQTDVGMNY